MGPKSCKITMFRTGPHNAIFTSVKSLSKQVQLRDSRANKRCSSYKYLYYLELKIIGLIILCSENRRTTIKRLKHAIVVNNEGHAGML